MKKIFNYILSIIILVLIMISLISFFKNRKDNNFESKSDKIQIIATLFPEYDFAKHIVGDKGEVKLLLNSGVEAHNFEPTAKDMIDILNSDMFLYIGNDLEPWTENIVNNLNETNSKVVDVAKNVELMKIEDFEEKYINSEIIEDEEHHDEHEEIYDEHIWMNPENAIIMIDNILEELCIIDPENSDYYKNNAENYKSEILELDNNLKNLIENSEKREIAVGGEFAYAYFVDHYNLKFVSVYKNCGEGEDPSIAKVKSVIDYINKYNMQAVYYEELSEGTVAKMIAEETNAEALVFYSIHNGDVNNDSYVSLMKKNLENLEKGLR